MALAIGYIVYCFLEFKLSYLKNLKLFSIKSKIIIWAYNFAENGDGFLLFLKAFSWETDLWVTLGDFKVKNTKRGKEIYLVEKKCGVRWLITIISVTNGQKDFFFRFEL